LRQLDPKGDHNHLHCLVVAALGLAPGQFDKARKKKNFSSVQFFKIDELKKYLIQKKK